MKNIFKNKKRYISLNALIILLSIIFILFFSCRKYNEIYLSTNDEIKKISELILKINKDCKIIKFLNINNQIDFLNIEEFSGNIVGSMELKNPENWDGPYLDYNPTYNGKLFSILNHKNGIYIVPGNETVLFDGAMIGREIIFNEDTDLEEIKIKYPSINPNGKSLIRKLNIFKD